jgi:hypothetical protein
VHYTQFENNCGGEDGKPDFYSRKACNYLEVAVEVTVSDPFALFRQRYDQRNA